LLKFIGPLSFFPIFTDFAVPLYFVAITGRLAMEPWRGREGAVCPALPIEGTPVPFIGLAGGKFFLP
jgi:hypothetical protein